MAVKKTGESKVKKVVGGIAVALALILVGGVCGGLLQHHYKWVRSRKWKSLAEKKSRARTAAAEAK